MAKNHTPSQTFLQTVPVSPSHPHTVDGVVNHQMEYDDDNDICPVCDGECTCSNRSFASLNSRDAHTGDVRIASHPQPSPHPALKIPPIKIKLTAPMLATLRTIPSTSRSVEETTSVTANDGDRTPSAPSTSALTQDMIFAKRRGRPPKAIVAARRAAAAAAVAQGLPCPLPPSKTRKGTQPKKSAATKKKAPSKTNAKRKRVRQSSDESSELTDVDQFSDNEDAPSLQFPTFISASVLASSVADDSSADSDSSSGFDTDSSIEEQEESFIRAEERARVKRELLLDGERHSNHDWEARPRSRSSDIAIDVDIDSDETEDDDDDDEDDEDDEDADEEDEEVDGRPQYVGLATSWSDDEGEESSFDADLFFANLSDSEEGSSSGCSYAGEDGDQSDLETMSIGEAAASILPHLQRSLEVLPFEVTERWDGQIVFTNGLGDGQSFLDTHFEAAAIAHAQVMEAPATPHRDVMMHSEDDEGYAQDIDADGETTDEDLVGDDDLPNAKAMQLFNTPFKGVCSINPLSTMSPSVSPAPRDCRARRSLSGSLDSPNPTDILSGKMFWEEEDAFDIDDSKVASSSKTGMPRKGQFNFDAGEDKKTLIIDGVQAAIPSPYPKPVHRGRGGYHSHTQSHDRMNPFIRKSLEFPRTASLPPSLASPAQVLSSSELSTDSLESELPSTQPIELDDVLDSSFLNSDPSDHYLPEPSSSSSANDLNPKHMKNLSRWDLISVGAFRKTREVGVMSDVDSAADYGTVMKSSPLSAMMWQNKNGLSRLNVSMSPALPPLREHDGDRTPTNPNGHTTPQKQTRKEQRRERKLKRKSHGPIHNHHQHHHHHQRQHHPNNKTRGTSSFQRNFSSSPSGSAPASNI